MLDEMPPWPLPPINHAFSNRNEIAISMSEEHRNEPCLFSPLWNAKPQTQRSLLSPVCTLGNSNIAITNRHCNFESALVWKHSNCNWNCEVIGSIYFQLHSLNTKLHTLPVGKQMRININRELRVDFWNLISDFFLLIRKPHFQTFNVVWMYWKAHLFRHFRLFLTNALTPLYKAHCCLIRH